MITTPFKNYDEFKELFVREKENGINVRKNGVLLAFLKSKEVRNYLRTWCPSIPLSNFNSMQALFQFCDEQIYFQSDRWSRSATDSVWYVCIGNESRCYSSDTYATDGRNGVCVDLSYKSDGTPDYSFYRYQNMKREGRVFKMKVGKLYRHIMDLTILRDVFPESVKLWLCEEKTRQWEAYSASKIPTDLFLHVDDDFQSIYGCGGVIPCSGSFGSCMQDTGDHWIFYRDSVKAKAAYLTRGDNDDSTRTRIVARCILFTDVTREDTGEVIRVAERQYSSGGDEILQRILIRKLIDGGYIDAYKKTGAGCGDSWAFVDVNGNDMSNVNLSIECTVSEGDYLAYQDSFKWYDKDGGVAYNYPKCGAPCEFSTTGLRYEHDDDDDDERNWSNYHDEYIDPDDSIYVESRDDYFYNDEVYDARVWNGHSYDWEYCFEDDCLYIDGDYYYAGEDCEDPEEYNIYRCPRCGEYFIGGESFYSDLTGEDYCSDSCRDSAEDDWHEDNGEVWCEWDNEWHDEDEVSKIASRKRCWCKSVLVENICDDDVEELRDAGQVIWDEIGEKWIHIRALRELMEYEEIAA